MENKKEFLNEDKYQQTEKKLLKISKILLIVGICLSATIITVGLINTNKKSADVKVESVDYVADTQNEIKQLKSQLEEKQPKFNQETENLTTKKNELLAKGVKESTDYNKGESYDLYILDTVLDPGYNSCWNEKFSKNTLSKEYCALKNDIEDIEDQIEDKEEYISSGRAEAETKTRNEQLKREAEWNSSRDRMSIMPYVMFAIPAFMFPGMIALMLFTTAKRRSIMAFTAQQTMPVAQEGIEKIAPTIGKAGASIAKEMTPVYKDIAKEISKGIKEGINEADSNKEE